MKLQWSTYIGILRVCKKYSSYTNAWNVLEEKILQIIPAQTDAQAGVDRNDKFFNLARVIIETLTIWLEINS